MQWPAHRRDLRLQPDSSDDGHVHPHHRYYHGHTARDFQLHGYGNVRICESQHIGQLDG
jgi:hypothetical protein